MTHVRFSVLLAALLISLLSPIPLGAQTDEDTVYFDGMDGLSPALLSEQSPDPSQFTYLYNDTQYNITALSPTYSGDLYSYLTLGQVADSSTSVDVAIENDRPGKYAFVGCRAGDVDNGYAFEVHPSTGDARIWILTGSPEILVEGNFIDLIAPGFVYNTIEIECFENLISGSINGEVVLADFDDTFTEGFSYVGGGVSSTNPGDFNVIFDNLTATHYGASSTTATTSESASQQTTTRGGLEGALAYAEANAPVAGPINASAELFDGDLKVLPALVSVSTFYAELGFVTPSNVPPGLWTAGFCFWRAADESCIELTVGSTGTTAVWFLADVAADGGYNLLDRGDLTGIDLTPGAQNTIGLHVEGQTATLTANSSAPALTVTLPRTGSGDIAAVLNYLAEADNEPGSFLMETFGFTIWDLAQAQSGGPAPTAAAQPTIPAAPTVATQPTVFVQPTIPAQPTVVVQPTTAAQPTVAGDPAVPSFEQLRSQAITQPPVSGPAAGSLTESAGTFPFALAGVNLGDLYATATFTNPTDTSMPWNIGMGVHYSDQNQEFRFIVDSAGQWMTAFGGGNAEPGGALSNFNAAPGATNTIEIITWQSTAWVAFNGVALSSFDVSANATTGDVFIGASFLNISVIEGRQIPYQEFSVFALSADSTTPVATVPGTSTGVTTAAGPYAGVLVESTDMLALAQAGINLADLYTSVTFAVPDDLSAPFQFGIGFRNVGGNDQLRLLVASTGDWSLSYGLDPPMVSGTVTNVLTTPGGENTLSIDVQGNTGIATLNGVQFATLDLSSWTAAGDVWIATGFGGATTVPGRIVRYHDFVVEPR